jgi:catechol 2,3-dioxygenase-like lactoylglutathione lyase family enzyme
MGICGIEGLTYGVEDVARCTRFFEDWGLMLLERGEHGADFALPDHSTLHIRSMHDRGLPPARVPGSTVRETVWAVESDEHLAALAGELARDRPLAEGTDGTLHFTDDTGYAIGLRRTARHLDPEPLAQTNTVGCIKRMDQRAAAAFAFRSLPRRFVHVVYWVPFELERAQRFYVERLGFRPTESVVGAAHFLRSQSASDHHNLLLQQRGRNYGFQHVSRSRCATSTK